MVDNSREYVRRYRLVEQGTGFIEIISGQWIAIGFEYSDQFQFLQIKTAIGVDIGHAQ